MKILVVILVVRQGLPIMTQCTQMGKNGPSFTPIPDAKATYGEFSRKHSRYNTNISYYLQRAGYLWPDISEIGQFE